MTEKVKLTDHQESGERHAGRISRERVLNFPTGSERPFAGFTATPWKTD
jgi:hypothetical protein